MKSCLLAVSLVTSLAAILFSVSSTASETGLSVQTGYGNHTFMEGLALSRSWDQHWFQQDGWALGGYWDVSVGQWIPHAQTGGNHEINDYGITPVFRYAPIEGNGDFIPFLEAGIGAHYLDRPDVYSGRDMTTHFQFGDHIGAGMTLGPQHDWDVMMRFQHLSNGGMQNPNPGINFVQLRVSHWF